MNVSPPLRRWRKEAADGRDRARRSLLPLPLPLHGAAPVEPGAGRPPAAARQPGHVRGGQRCAAQALHGRFRSVASEDGRGEAGRHPRIRRRPAGALRAGQLPRVRHLRRRRVRGLPYERPDRVHPRRAKGLAREDARDLGEGAEQPPTRAGTCRRAHAPRLRHLVQLRGAQQGARHGARVHAPLHPHRPGLRHPDDPVLLELLLRPATIGQQVLPSSAGRCGR